MANNKLIKQSHPGESWVVRFVGRDGAVWNGTAMVAWVNANYSTYCIAATETPTDSGNYVVAIPAGLPAGAYQAEWSRVVASAAQLADQIEERERFEWNGTDILSAAADTAAARAAIADAVLSRNVSNSEAAAPLTSLVTMILAATNKANTTAHPGKLTIYRTDGTTEHAQIPISTDHNADPIDGVG